MALAVAICRQGGICKFNGANVPDTPMFITASGVEAADYGQDFFDAPAALVRTEPAAGAMTALRNTYPGLSDDVRARLPVLEPIAFGTGPDQGDMTKSASALLSPPKTRTPLRPTMTACRSSSFWREDDPVVPRAQARALIDASLARGLPVMWEFHPGEGHGFKQRANIVRSLSEERAFNGKSWASCRKV